MLLFHHISREEFIVVTQLCLDSLVQASHVLCFNVFLTTDGWMDGRMDLKTRGTGFAVMSALP